MRMHTWLAFAIPSLLVIGPSVAHAQDVFPAQELKFDAKIARFASKASNPCTYVLLGNGYLRMLSAHNENESINHWLEVQWTLPFLTRSTSASDYVSRWFRFSQKAELTLALLGGADPKGSCRTW
jgi:hypothetical protein